jgi:hypothetical protein
MTPSWSPFERNLGWTIEVVVILIESLRVQGIYRGGDEDNGGPFFGYKGRVGEAGRRIFQTIQDLSPIFAMKECNVSSGCGTLLGLYGSQDLKRGCSWVAS